MANDDQRSPGQGNSDAAPGQRRLPLLAILKSLAAAAFGVQSSRNRERDFAHGNYRHFIIGGILFAAMFVLTIAFVVSIVLKQAGAP